MKGKTKTQKGITLIALIITIVVLLILAVVTINSIKGDGIISYADNSTEKYKDAQTKEEGTLGYYEAYLAGERAPIGTWTQKGATLTKVNEDGTKMQIKIGDYVNYNEGTGHTHTPDTTKGAGISTTGGDASAGYTLGTDELTTENLTWRVLGLNEKGEIELISADPTTQGLCLANEEGYLNAETTYNEDGSVKELGTLDKFCNDLYGQGTDSEGKKLATGARSLNVDDINKLTNYDPKTFSGYGDIWTYRYPTTEEVSGTRHMQYRRVKSDGAVITDWTNITESSYQKFRLPEETTLINSNNPDSKELESTYYWYGIASNLTTDDGFTSEEATAISNMICRKTTGGEGSFWLASRSVRLSSVRASFLVLTVMRSEVYSMWMQDLYSGSCFYSNGDSDAYTYKVRPVVSLKSDINITGSDSDIGSSTNMWQITLK